MAFIKDGCHMYIHLSLHVYIHTHTHAHTHTTTADRFILGCSQLDRLSLGLESVNWKGPTRSSALHNEDNEVW